MYNSTFNFQVSYNIEHRKPAVFVKLIYTEVVSFILIYSAQTWGCKKPSVVYKSADIAFVIVGMVLTVLLPDETARTYTINST